MPKPPQPLPPLSELHALFAYDPETGFIINRLSLTAGASLGRPRLIGGRAEYWGRPRVRHGVEHGRVSVRGRFILAHRVAWALFYNEDPGSSFIDHINGDRRDNRILNLRLCKHQENCLNQKLRSDNKTGTKCVTWDASQRNYRVRITVKQQHFHIGRFKTLAEAVAAAEAARPKLHGEFSRE
jgi:hypothetical protein